MSGEPSGEFDRLLRRLGRRRSAARLALLIERLWPALWPACGVAGLFVCCALFGLFGVLPRALHALALAGFAVALAVLLVRGARRVVPPGREATDRRIERASGLSHRPLAVLADRPAVRDAESGRLVAPLWQAHVERALRQAGRLRVGLPRPGLARVDRRALRLGLLVSLVAALAVAGTDAPARLADALRPNLPPPGSEPAPQLQVWVTPPPYTGLAPVFLKPDGGAVSVPEGTHLAANLTGGTGDVPSLVLDGHADRFQALDAASFQVERDLAAGGRLAVRRNGADLAAWELTVVANQPPVVSWPAAPGPAARGVQTSLPWQVADQYGVVRLQAELRLRDRPDAPPVLLALPVPGGAVRAAKGVSTQDLTANPWAGLPVIARLNARDAAGLAGASAAAEFVLPERAFRNPVARQLMALRKLLSLSPDRADVLAGLDRLLLAPEALAGDMGAYLNLADIYGRLVRGRGPDIVPDAQGLMWRLALHLEEGGSERTARALEAAREAAREAMDRLEQQPTEQNRSALEQRLDELRAALREHMAALAEQARKEGAEAPPDAERLDSREMERKAEEAKQAAREGRMEDAKQKLAELEKMLDQLRNARVEHGPADAQQEGKRQRGRSQMGALQDMIGRQGGLLDHAQGRADQDDPRRGARPNARRPNGASPQPRQGQGQSPGQSQGPGQQQGQRQGGASPGAEGDSGRESDQRVQQALRRALGELMQQYGDLTGDIPQSLGEADAAMRDAREALSSGQDGAAGEAQLRAIEALQKGGREMSQQLSRQFGRAGQGEEGDSGDPDGAGFSMQEGRDDPQDGSQGTMPGRRGHAGKTDPLGRDLDQGTSGSDEADSVRVPEEMERQRTRAIQDELRRRGADRARPQPELDYIDRLLRQF